MEIKELYHLTNTESIEYLNSKRDWIFLGVEEGFDDLCNSYLVVLEDSLKNEQEKVIRVYCLPKKDSNGMVSYFSKFENFCIYAGCNIAKIKITYDYRGYIEWPIYRGTQKQQDVYFKKYTELHKKYDKYLKSDCA